MNTCNVVKWEFKQTRWYAPAWNTPLHRACEANDVEQCKLLISQGEDVNCPDSRNLVPLLCCKSAAMVDILLAAGADLHKINWVGHLDLSPLPSYLLERAMQANLDMEVSRNAALGFAIRYKCFNICRHLVQLGVQMHGTYDDDERYYFEHYDYYTGDDCGVPLMFAADKRCPQICRMLIENGANPNYRCYFLPLCLAAEEGDHETCLVLIDGGADVNLQDEKGGTPLFYAADEGSIPVVRLLVANGANINHSVSYGRGNHFHNATALFQASLAKHLELCKYLLRHGATMVDEENDEIFELTEDGDYYMEADEYHEDQCKRLSDKLRYSLTLFCKEICHNAYFFDGDPRSFYAFILCAQRMGFSLPIDVLRQIKPYICVPWGSFAQVACESFEVWYGMDNKPL